jgi:hypothetical protein
MRTKKPPSTLDIATAVVTRFTIVILGALILACVMDAKSLVEALTTVLSAVILGVLMNLLAVRLNGNE